MVSVKLLKKLLAACVASLPLLYAYGAIFDHGRACAAASAGAVPLMVIPAIFAMWLANLAMGRKVIFTPPPPFPPC